MFSVVYLKMKHKIKIKKIKKIKNDFSMNCIKFCGNGYKFLEYQNELNCNGLRIYLFIKMWYFYFFL